MPLIYTFYKSWGNSIYLRYKKGSETVAVEYKDYTPRLYSVAASGEESNTDFVSIYGNKLHEIKFKNIKEASGFIKQYNNVGGMRIEGNTKFDNQFIIDINEGKQPEYIAKNINGIILDIEVDVLDGDPFPKPIDSPAPINIITAYSTKYNKFYTFSLGAYKDSKWVKEHAPEYLQTLDIEYIQFDTEVELLEFFIKWWCSEYPDFTSGWNSALFDMPYLVNRIEKIFGSKTLKVLSPFGHVSQKNDEYKNIYTVDIMGVPHLDYLDLYKKHIFTPRESYKLDFIAECEVGANKIEHEESFDKFYRNRFQDFVSYNIHDVNLIRLIDDKLGLFSVTFALAYFTLSNYEDTLGTVKIWEELAAKYLYTIKKVPLSSQEDGIKRGYEGAFVWPVVEGKHEWVISLDLNSLYPHNEMQYNIGLETYVPYKDLPAELKVIADSKFTVDDLVNANVDLSVLKKYNYAMTPNKQFYRKDFQSFFSCIKEQLYADRKVHKKKMLKSESELVAVKAEIERRGI